MITHLEPDILECEVKWALGSITTNKASGGDGIPVELFKILKNDAATTLNMPANLENTVVATGLEKISFHSNPKERQCQRMLKLLHRSDQISRSVVALISHACKVMLKILQARLQQYVNCELPYIQAGLRKGRGARYQIANIHWIIEKAREFQKNICLCFIDYAKAFNCVDHNKRRKILQEMGIPDHLTCLLSNLYAGQEATVRTGHRTTDWFQIRKGVR